MNNPYVKKKQQDRDRGRERSLGYVVFYNCHWFDGSGLCY